jgi:membrane-bound serine protease (ClpP class)
LVPAGKVFVHGELWDAVASGNVPAGEKVVVRKVNGLQLQVERTRSEQKAAVS